MAVKVRTKTNKIPLMEKEFNSLNGKKVQVGVLGGGEHAWLAGIHEYGCTITAKRAKYLTVPCNKKSFGKKAGDFNDLFFLETDEGSKWLVREKGKDQLEFMFWLTKSVHIPERSFLRAGHDENVSKVIKRVEDLLKKIGSGESADALCETIGLLLADRIKDYARKLQTPPKSSITLAASPNKTNPLIQTGDMINSITYRVE